MSNDGALTARDISCIPTVNGADNVQDALEGGGGSGGSLTASAVLDSAQITTLFSAPTLIIPPPGAGKLIVPGYWVCQFVPGADAILNSSGGALQPALFYDDGNPPGDANNASDNGALPTDATPSLFATLGASSDSAVATVVASGNGVVFGNRSADPTRSGPIFGAVLLAGGVGYAPGDTGTFTSIAGTGGTYTVDTVDGGGAVLTFTVTADGDGYTVDDAGTAVTTGGGDGNFAVTVSLANDGQLFVDVTYTIVALH